MPPQLTVWPLKPLQQQPKIKLLKQQRKNLNSALADQYLKKLEGFHVVGIDEAGRGCLAGNVYAGAVILNPNSKSEHFRDSKLLSEKRREALFEEILSEHRAGIGFATVEEITKLNILRAAQLAMVRAYEALLLTPEEVARAHIVVDGNLPIRGLSVPQTPIVKGDQVLKCISAASIVAKVSRDREIRRLAEIYPQYGLSAHKGYATKEHMEAIRVHGPAPIHRPTFGGVREHVTRPTE